MSYRIQGGPAFCSWGGMACRTVGLGGGRAGAWGATAKGECLPPLILTWDCQLEQGELRQTFLGNDLKFVAGWVYFMHRYQ